MQTIFSLTAYIRDFARQPQVLKDALVTGIPQGLDGVEVVNGYIGDVKIRKAWTMTVEHARKLEKAKQAAAYFEDAVRESDLIIVDCSDQLAAELAEQKEHFVVALEALRRYVDQLEKGAAV